MKFKPDGIHIELNGVAVALAKLRMGDPTEEVIETLEMFSKYVKEYYDNPIFWHEFKEKYSKKKG